jgi:glucosamine--fructose-6-phosphate aminotransferase (isomerizing)
MCGIVGYVGHRAAPELLISSLQRLEYRGYDSAGIAVPEGDALVVLKSPGKVRTLGDRMLAEWSPGLLAGARTGIAHTRWATHGPPTQVNAHPHCDQSGRIALVHNGIIENYADIRRQLEAKGHTFASQTDSEVFCHLIGEYYSDGDLLQAVCAAMRHAEGTLGIAVLCADQPDRLVIARRGSPIVVGIGDGETFVASDAAAIVAHTNRVIYLNDDDVAVVTAGSVEVRTVQNVPVAREIARLEWDSEAAEKGGFAHFMLKEIFEQPDAIRNSTRGRLDEGAGSAKLGGLAMTPREIAEIGRMVMVACGTSMHAGLVGRFFFEDLADLPAEVEQAAEFRYRNPILSPRDLVLAISQSGETADTLAAVREAKQKGAVIAGLCNVVGSTIARETGRGVYLHAGPEIGVASTKAFTCQVSVLLMMALKFGRCRRLSRDRGLEICRAIAGLPDAAARVIEQNDEIARIAGKYAGIRDMFFIGRGTMYPVALEGALKLKEISYIHAEGYHAAELKHGPIAMLDPAVPVLAIATDTPGREKMVGNIQECRARHSPVIAIVSGDDRQFDGVAADVIRIPSCPALAAPIPVAIALQLFAYHVARARGCEIDQPRNLAKSVTVE